jgi:hypothetical protein
MHPAINVALFFKAKSQPDAGWLLAFIPLDL